LLQKQNISEKENQEQFFVSQNQKIFPQQMFRSRGNGETCFRNNASSFARALTQTLALKMEILFVI